MAKTANTDEQNLKTPATGTDKKPNDVIEIDLVL